MEQAQYKVNEKTMKWKAFLAENKIECFLNAVIMETAKFLETEYAPIMARVWKAIK